MKLRLLLLSLVLAGSAALAGPLDSATKELRYCGAPARDAQGVIIRRSDVLTAFKKEHPCPSTGLKTGACPGWAMDHVIPIACGGCDAVYNLQWMPDGLKSSAGTLAKDRWERLVYANPAVYTNLACTNRVINPTP